jgi:isoprenylcysteine carboxyl methyltransferase (ICMT) family protein YpbQ
MNILEGRKTMELLILLCFIIVFACRLFFLRVSKNNEQHMIQMGGKEFGIVNTILLTMAHIIFYASAFTESWIRKASFNWISFLGILVLTFSLFMLMIVVKQLGEFWTIKLIIAKNHYYIDTWLFRNIKHPNYFLNIIPELIGMSMLCHAWTTLTIVFPLYLVILIKRIRQENEVMISIKQFSTSKRITG